MRTPKVVRPSDIFRYAAGNLLQLQIENGEHLLANRPVSTGEFSTWATAARASIEWIYGADSESYRLYKGRPGHPAVEGYARAEGVGV